VVGLPGSLYHRFKLVCEKLPKVQHQTGTEDCNKNETFLLASTKFSFQYHNHHLKSLDLKYA